MTKKGFVLSWFYPPGNSSEGIVTYKLLSRSKYMYDVWTRENQRQNLWDRNVDENELNSDNIKVLKCKADSQTEWMDAAIEYFDAHSDEYDFVMSRSMPALAHDVAREIVRRHPNVKWVASFGDPLVNTPYIRVKEETENPYRLGKYIEKESPSKVKLMRIAVSRMRRAQKFIWTKKNKLVSSEFAEYDRINDAAIRGADLIIVNNEYQLSNMFFGKYEAYTNKGFVVPHSFEPSFYPGNGVRKNQGKVIFTYTGHLDNQRSPRVFLRAVAKMKKRNEKLSDLMQVNFYGHLSNKDKIYILDNDLFDIIHLCGDVSYKESLNIMSKSDWLLLFDANFSGIVDENIYFPAKLADYIGSKSNIFAITQPKGATADIVRRVGGGIVCSHCVDEIFMYLSMILFKGFSPAPQDKGARMEFESKNVAGLLDKRIGSLLEK